MDQTIIRIPARSRRQAMDLSLVLASQGIECVIESPNLDVGWGILVAARDHDSATTAIQQYLIENRNWPWQQRVLQPGTLFDWGSLAWVAILVIFFWLDGHNALQNRGLMDSTEVARGQWWRLFTAVWLHADAAHLAANATIGVVLLGLAMGRYGTGAGLLAAYVAGTAGNAIACLMPHTQHLSLGASGMVMGSLGLLIFQSLSSLRQETSLPGASNLRSKLLKEWPATERPGSHPKYLIGAVLAGIMLFILLGLSPGTDITAHTGGFVSGLLLGGLLTLAHINPRSPKMNAVCGLVFVVLVILPWWLAFKHS